MDLPLNTSNVDALSRFFLILISNQSFRSNGSPVASDSSAGAVLANGINGCYSGDISVDYTRILS